MATTMAQKHMDSKTIGKKSYTQTVTIALGCLLVIIGLSGILNDEFMGLHLPAMHSLVLVGAGFLSIWSASFRSSIKAFYVDLGLGIFFALNAIAGFMLGKPGTPSVGYEGFDAFLVQYAPGFVELGIVDHILHSFLAVFYITGAFSWKRHHNQKSYE